MKKNKLLALLIGSVSMILSSCSSKTNDEQQDDGKIHVNFDTCISLKTNNIKEQIFDAPSKVKKPVVVIIEENPDMLEIQGWYKDREFTTEWNFKTDIANQSMTLYANFVPQYEVKYYQGINENSMNLIATELVFKDEVVPVREDLPDCYENPGNFYIENLEENSDGTLKGTKGSAVNFGVDKVNKHVNILLQKSENFYLSPSAIGRRFTSVAASSGQNGATSGRISVERWHCSTCDKNFTDYQVEEDHVCPECGEAVTSLGNEEYARIDFGQLSATDSVCDPYILMDNPQIDVTKSKEIEITVKNLGYGETLSFYWVGKWAINGAWINGKEFHSFNEEASFKIGNGIENNTQKGSMAASYLKEQNENDEWQTFRIPVSEKIDKGVSIWGCMGKLTALRIQSSFNITKAKEAGKDITKLKNEILIKSIKGIDTGVQYEFEDSSTVKSIVPSSSQALSEKAITQSDVEGFIFPKNNSSIVKDQELEDHTTAEVIERVDGTYFHSNFTDGKQTIVLKPEKEITLDTLTTFSFSYKNFSYVNSLTFSIGTQFEKNGRIQNKKLTNIFSIKQTMSKFEEGKINFFGNANFKGVLTDIQITYTPIGIDNLIGFEYIKFEEYQLKEISGIQFNDLYVANPEKGGFTANGDISINYTAEHKGAEINVSSSNNKISKSINYNSMINDSFNLNYENPGDGITKINVSFTIGDNNINYAIDTEVSNETITKKVEMPTNERGRITDISVSFVGTGTIYLKSLEWNLVNESLNLSNGEFYNKCAKFNAMSGFTYNEEELGISVSSNSKFMYCRLGAWGYTVNNNQVVNMSIAGKTKIAMLYQNTGDSGTTNPYISYGAILKSDHLENDKYLTADGIQSSSVTIGGETKKPGLTEANRVSLTKNMKSGEWDVVTFDIDPFFTTVENECYLSCFFLQTATVTGTITIRAFAIL